MTKTVVYRIAVVDSRTGRRSSAFKPIYKTLRGAFNAADKLHYLIRPGEMGQHLRVEQKAGDRWSIIRDPGLAIRMLAARRDPKKKAR